METDRPVRGGLLAALGATIKLTPAVLVLVFALRGRWRAAAAALIGIVLIAGLLPAAVLGPELTARLTGQICDKESRRLNWAEDHDDVVGESLRAMSYRLLGPLPLVKQGVRVDASLGLLTAGQAWWFYRGAAVLLLLWLVGFARWNRAPLAYGAALCTILLVSPETRQAQFLMLLLPVTAGSVLLAGVGFRTGRVLVPLGLAFLLAAVPSRGILGAEAARWAAALCASGFATVSCLVALGLAAGLPEPDGDGKEEGA